eukprot:CAMPEP_0170827750 /NCGR_PEP_ID=MMETSP0733-20121128/47435_1 /TAXON_ID=186038 /ORGANISM="Fragilariopsis kerguelensis, Strain L26-C5" /LENGTH=178 /DNA_ID=CAMNT_0011191949 /DNA_START=91 /DNA_END=628 /DNA_ORIENTATION=-
MTSNSLNAGASTFTPGGSSNDNNKSVLSTGTIGSGSQLRDSFTEMVEGIDNVIDQDAHGTPSPSDVTTPPTSGGVNAINAPALKTSLPSHMAKHAADFGFQNAESVHAAKDSNMDASAQLQMVVLVRVPPMMMLPQQQLRRQRSIVVKDKWITLIFINNNEFILPVVVKSVVVVVMVM